MFFNSSSNILLESKFILKLSQTFLKTEIGLFLKFEGNGGILLISSNNSSDYKKKDLDDLLKTVFFKEIIKSSKTTIIKNLSENNSYDYLPKKFKSFKSFLSLVINNKGKYSISDENIFYIKIS